MFHKKDTILSLSLKQLLPIRKSQPGVFVLVYFISNRNWVIWTAVLGKKNYKHNYIQLPINRFNNKS